MEAKKVLFIRFSCQNETETHKTLHRAAKAFGGVKCSRKEKLKNSICNRKCHKRKLEKKTCTIIGLKLTRSGALNFRSEKEPKHIKNKCCQNHESTVLLTKLFTFYKQKKNTSSVMRLSNTHHKHLRYDYTRRVINQLAPTHEKLKLNTTLKDEQN